MLSTLAYIPIGSENGSIETWLNVLCCVGSFEDVLFRVDNQPIELMKEFHTHELSNGTHLLCGKIGIIEPITQAMQNGFVLYPEQMAKLVELACKNGNEQLRTRLNVAAMSLFDITDSRIRSCVIQAHDILTKKS